MKQTIIDLPGIVLALALLPCTAIAFDSGSTGADGDFNPPVSIEVPLPPSGILNYRSVDIPLGVTVRFKRNDMNTPVTILVAGDAAIAGTINLDGESAPPSGPVSGNDNPLDDGFPGKGGPGGFDGGFGGLLTGVGPAANVLGSGRGGAGMGPGGGGGGDAEGNNTGGGAGHASSGQAGSARAHVAGATGGAAYGSEFLLPLIGGSGGGGAGVVRYNDTDWARGGGGNGGGGALLMAVSGTLNFSGRISARGGDAPWLGPENLSGGAGSGGAIRLVATMIAGHGKIDALGGKYHLSPGASSGGEGRIRLEADNLVGIGPTSPAFTFGVPGALFVAGQPALRFSTIAGIPAPASSTGFGDLTIPAATANPVAIVLATTGIPVGSTVKVSVIPQYGQPNSVDSPPTAGALGNATTSVSLDIPPGHSVLSAQTSFTVVAAVGDALSRFAQGERVEKITLTSTLGQGDKATLHTVGGRQFDVEPALLKLATLSQ
jgi:hypothetical protein